MRTLATTVIIREDSGFGVAEADACGPPTPASATTRTLIDRGPGEGQWP